VRYDHVAIRAGLLVERGALRKADGLGHIDLHMVDEVAVPDRLEQAVREAEREDVLRRLLAEEMIDAEDLLFAEHFVQPAVEFRGALEIRAEGLFHDDARAFHEAGFAEGAHCGQRGVRRHAEVMQAATLTGERLLRLLHRCLERGGPARDRHIIERLREIPPVGVGHLARAELLQRGERELAEAIAIDVVEGDSDDAASGDEARRDEVEQARQQLAPREIARCSDQHDDVRITRTNTSWNLRHDKPRADTCVRDHARSTPA
jgi:hypothetical protein